ncbi:MAG: hypothetical protein ACRDHZ_24430 [Ktedonobacteraceae bacterium]
MAQGEQVENALWNALKALEEKGSLSRRIVQRARENGHSHLVESFEAQIQHAEKDAHILRQFLLQPAPEQDSQAIKESSAE